LNGLPRKQAFNFYNYHPVNQNQKRNILSILIFLLFGASCFFLGRHTTEGPGQQTGESLNESTPKASARYIAAKAATKAASVQTTVEKPALDPIQILGKPPLLDPTGLLSPFAVRSFSLTDQEQIQVTNAIRELHEAIEATAKAHLKKDVLRSNAKTNELAYRIESFPEEGGLLYQKFTKDCSDILGVERGKRLAVAYPRPNKYGSLGANDVLIIFKSENQEFDGSLSIPCTIEEYDPKSGRRLGARYGEYATLKSFFGNMFDVNDVP